MGILWEFPQKTCGNGMGMGIEIPFPRQPCRVVDYILWPTILFVVMLVSKKYTGSSIGLLLSYKIIRNISSLIIRSITFLTLYT